MSAFVKIMKLSSHIFQFVFNVYFVTLLTEL